jgi:hypothetical protein
MAKKTKEDVVVAPRGFVILSPEEKLKVARAAEKDFSKIPAAHRDAVVAVINKYFLQIGYKPLVRLLRGKTPEQAISKWGKGE